MPHPRTVVLDACVLYSAPLRDLLIRVGQAGLIRARWTEAIHDEWMRNVLANLPQVSAERLQRTRELMDAAIRDCLIVGYEQWIPRVTLPDPNDRHVLAAAIHAGATAIVTFNLRDFPDAELQPHGLAAIHPDELFDELIELSPGEMCAVARKQRAALQRPPQTVTEFLDTLEKQSLSRTASRLREFLDEL